MGGNAWEGVWYLIELWLISDHTHSLPFNLQVLYCHSEKWVVSECVYLFKKHKEYPIAFLNSTRPVLQHWISRKSFQHSKAIFNFFSIWAAWLLTQNKVKSWSLGFLFLLIPRFFKEIIYILLLYNFSLLRIFYYVDFLRWHMQYIFRLTIFGKWT